MKACLLLSPKPEACHPHVTLNLVHAVLKHTNTLHMEDTGVGLVSNSARLQTKRWSPVTQLNQKQHCDGVEGAEIPGKPWETQVEDLF